MNLDEFKSALENDASKRCEEQEKTIKKLHEQINELIDHRRVLLNRCRAMLGGIMCLHCGLRQICQAERSEE